MLTIFLVTSLQIRNELWLTWLRNSRTKSLPIVLGALSWMGENLGKAVPATFFVWRRKSLCSEVC